MSKQAIIGINGGLVPFSETVDKLRTPGIGGSDITWVPEDQTRCESLRVTANGTYPAASAGKYGYNYVTVSVAGDSVTGLDGDGDEATATPDPDTGIIEYTKIPSRIEITTPPTKLVYIDGETIDFTGAVVKAYLETGGEYGTIPNGEITLNPNKAVYDAATDHPASYTSDLETVFDMPIPSGHVTVTWVDDRNGQETQVTYGVESGYTAGFAIGSIGDTRVSFLSAKQGTAWHPLGDERSIDNFGTTYFGGDHKTIKAITGAVATYTGTLSGGDENAALWTIIYGEQVSSAGSPQTITVSWPRPGDGAILETSFNITVTPASQEE